MIDLLDRLARRSPPIFLALAAAVVLAGCSTSHPRPLGESALAEAQTFPYYPVYWVGPRFASDSLSAADGRKGYNTSIGDSVYYGDCAGGKGILETGSCQIPLQVTTVIYRQHSNAALGPQHNTVIRGVPATVYDDGRSIELYSGRQAIDVFSDTPTHALLASQALRPLNAPGSATDPLPAPVFCPGLSGPMPADVKTVMERLPRRACQSAAAALEQATVLRRPLTGA
jgi:hypothetical protein